MLNKTSVSLLSALVLATVILAYSACDRIGGSDVPSQWLSPYSDVDWDNVIQAKAQLHTHTTVSDGYLSPQIVVDLYDGLGYHILAITDHWVVTYPWQDFTEFEPSARTERRLEEGDLQGIPREHSFVFDNRDPAQLGMIAVQGSEPSHTGRRQHHIVSLFSDVTGRDMDFEETLAAIGEDGGLVSFAHPARSTERNNNEPADYVYYFDNYIHIYGIDIFTRATYREPERWPIATKLMADILRHYGPASEYGWRPIWFTATDDLHSPDDIDQAFQIQLVRRLDDAEVYRSLTSGTFFWVAKAMEESYPTIQSIEMEGSTITVNGSGFDRISWYFDDQVVHTGESFDYLEHGPEGIFYVYFIAYTEDFSIEERRGAMIGSQPFWVADW